MKKDMLLAIYLSGIFGSVFLHGAEFDLLKELASRKEKSEALKKHYAEHPAQTPIPGTESKLAAFSDEMQLRIISSLVDVAKSSPFDIGKGIAGLYRSGTKYRNLLQDVPFTQKLMEAIEKKFDTYYTVAGAREVSPLDVAVIINTPVARSLYIADVLNGKYSQEMLENQFRNPLWKGQIMGSPGYFNILKEILSHRRIDGSLYLSQATLEDITNTALKNAYDMRLTKLLLSFVPRANRASMFEKALPRTILNRDGGPQIQFMLEQGLNIDTALKNSSNLRSSLLEYSFDEPFKIIASQRLSPETLKMLMEDGNRLLKPKYDALRGKNVEKTPVEANAIKEKLNYLNSAQSRF